MTGSPAFAPSRLRVNEILEQHFDAAFAAPDGIAKLRELILTLAMQGKLVEQDPNDPPASELLREIEKEKEKVSREGAKTRRRKEKTLPPIKPEEVPYELPQGWEWVRLGEITDYNGRKNISGDEIAPDTWLLDLEDIEKGTSRILYRAKFSERQSKSTKSTFHQGDVLYGKLRPYLDKVVVADSDGVCTTEIVPIIPLNEIHPEFLRWLLKRPAFLAHVNSLMYGVKMPRLGTDDAVTSIHPLPPLPEQHRIVARIDQLMARCDALEKLRKQREEKRLAVHAAAIKQLLDPTLRAFAPSREKNLRAFVPSCETKEPFAFLARHFGELHTVKENVAELRKAILQLAVMGRLVPQDSNDPPASELLKEIEAEKQRVSREGAKARRVKENNLPPIKPEEVPYELPQGWEWVKLGEVAEIIGGFAFKSTLFKNEGDKQVLRLGNIRPDQLRLSENPVFIDDDQAESTSNYCLIAGDILITMTGTREKRDYLYSVRIAENPINGKYLFLNQRVGAIRAFIDTEYLNKAIKVESIKDIIYRTATGSANQANIGISALREWTLPLPPLPEQHRIVARIDQLMALCDSLDQQIDAATGKQTELLNAVMGAL